MTGDIKPKKKIRKLLGIVGSLLSLAVLTYIAITLISGRDLNLSWVTDIFFEHEPVEMAEEYHFDVGRSRVFADLDGSLAAAGTLGVQVLDIGGDELVRDPFRMSNPAINATGDKAIAFDIGGTAVRVFDKARVDVSIETSEAIVSASINRNGWFCVNTLGNGGLKGIATVYSSKGNPTYKVSLSSGYILSAALSPDNSSLAILSLTDSSSRITFYHGLDKETADSEYDLPGGLILDIWYPPDGDLVAISTESLISVSRDGVSSELSSFSGKKLGAYTFVDNLYTLYLLDYGVGYRGQLMVLSADGSKVSELATDREIISMSSSGGDLAVLRKDGFSFFSAELEERATSVERISISGATQILALGNGAALATGDHLAVACHVAS